ncbi:hypothetical protein ANN_24739 [Periplaneta americana]|uniref:Uncharacterized protein n=1 Tax=Periplaneta americana TaxID=6978 RepID=A0ABQ8RZF5_PERAM|nr:hypothetical protein ANN_24739 [Periplaneta americana]
MVFNSVMKRKQNLAGNESNWLKMRHIKYSKAHGTFILYKGNLNEIVEIEELDLRKVVTELGDRQYARLGINFK